MVENNLMWMEIGFDGFYLISIWALVGLIKLSLDQVPAVDRLKANQHIWWAFLSLAFGDTFHVGTRIAAYFLPAGLEVSFRLLGREFGLIGWSAFITAITVTLFYLFFLLVWIERFQPQKKWISVGLFIVTGIRFGLLMLPFNQWNQPVPVQPWSLIRNLPLIILGLGVAVMLIRSAGRTQETYFRSLGLLMILSFCFYLPVILFVQSYPLLGMLMIPKTVAYLLMGLHLYVTLFRSPSLKTVYG